MSFPNFVHFYILLDISQSSQSFQSSPKTQSFQSSANVPKVLQKFFKSSAKVCPQKFCKSSTNLSKFLQKTKVLQKFVLKNSAKVLQIFQNFCKKQKFCKSSKSSAKVLKILQKFCKILVKVWQKFCKASSKLHYSAKVLQMFQSFCKNKSSAKFPKVLQSLAKVFPQKFGKNPAKIQQKFCKLLQSFFKVALFCKSSTPHKSFLCFCYPFSWVFLHIFLHDYASPGLNLFNLVVFNRAVL